MKLESTPRAQDHYVKLEDVLGCKWSVSVLRAISDGVQRPGALERHIPGISTKVLNERLRKLQAFGLITKTAYESLPPRTVFSLTPNGTKVVAIIAQIDALDDELQRQR